MVVQVSSGFVIRGHLFAIKGLLVVDMTFVLLLIARRVIGRFSFKLLQAVLRSNPVNLFRFAILGRLVRTKGDLANFHGGGGATRKTIRPVNCASGSVSKFLVFVFRVLLSDF